MSDLTKRLEAIKALEEELVHKGFPTIQAGTQMTTLDFFLLGAIKRTLAQSFGFRTLVESWNFSCATIMVRTQLDTAMRINGIRFLANPDADVHRIFNNEATFPQLKSVDGKPMRDAYLRERLAEKHPWVSDVYKETSDFVHLSFRHYWPTLVGADDESQTFNMVLSGEDPKHDETNYYEVADAFCHASKLTATLIVAALRGRHSMKELMAKQGMSQPE